MDHRPPSPDRTERGRTASDIVQPLVAGALAALVGFASTFALMLAGFAALGASPAEAGSGLFALSVAAGILNIALSLHARIPVAIAWSTPAGALFLTTGTLEGGYGAAVGAFLMAAALIVLAGLWRPFARAVAAIPMPIANAMLAGILLELCLAPLRAVEAMPLEALSIIAAWALALAFARRYAVPIAVMVTGIVLVVAVDLPPGFGDGIAPQLVWVTPSFTFEGFIRLTLPLFVVTMASQNLPGLAVMRANGYRADAGKLFVWTGLGSGATALFGGHTICLAAITAALCAGPEAHPDPARRWLAPVAAGGCYLLLAPLSAVAAALVAVSPPLLIQTVAGLALMSSLAGALRGAMDQERHVLPAVVTFVTTASGITLFGLGAPFWGVAFGIGLLGLLAVTARRAS